MGSTLLKNIYYKNNMNLVITSPLILILLSTPLLAYGLVCPDGTYIGRDNGGQEACRDIETNNIVDPKTAIQVFQGEEIDGSRVIIIVIVFIVIIVIAIAASKSGGRKTETSDSQYKTPEQYIDELRRKTIERQGGKCASCIKTPYQWKFKIKQHEGTGKSFYYGYCSDCFPV